MATQKAVPGSPGLYVREGVRRSTYNAMILGKYVPLGYDQDAAKLALAKMLEKPLPFAERTVRAMCRAFLAEIKENLDDGNNEALSPRTISDYESSLNRYIIPIFGDMHPDDVTKNHIAKYLKDARKPMVNAQGKVVARARPVRANKDRAAFSSAFKYGLGESLVKSNPCHGVPRNKEKPRSRLVSIQEFNELMAHAEALGGSAYMVALIVATVALTGRRRKEILHLKTEELLQEGFRVVDSKNPNRFYLIEWSDQLLRVVSAVRALNALRDEKYAKRVAKGRAQPRQESPFLFATIHGATYTDLGFNTQWGKLINSFVPEGPSSEKWFTAHDLRALYVTNMLAQNRDPKTHQNEKTMDRIYNRAIRISPLA